MDAEILSSSNGDNVIARFGDVELVEQGSLHVLDLEAIRERSGRRWAVRQDLVREFIERQFERRFRPGNHLVQLDDRNFLVVQPNETGHAAQGHALRLLSDVLKYFLGASARSDMKLMRVTKVGPDGIETAPVELSDADFSALTKDPELERSAVSPPLIGGQLSTWDSGGPSGAAINGVRTQGRPPLVGDRTYEAMFAVEPIWGIRQRAVVSYMLRPVIFEYQADRMVDANLSNATPTDLIRLNLIVLAEAKRVLEQQRPDARFALHVPIQHASLGSTTGRRALLLSLERLGSLASSSIVVVLSGLEVGAPQSRILELTSLLAGRCRAVVALAPDLGCKFDRWRNANLSGVAADLSALACPPEDLSIKRMTEFGSRLKGVAPALFAYSTPNTAVTLAAWSAGFTHVGGEFVLRHQAGPPQPLRLDPIELWRGTRSRSS